jgi:hypothetical protein
VGAPDFSVPLRLRQRPAEETAKPGTPLPKSKAGAPTVARDWQLYRQVVDGYYTETAPKGIIDSVRRWMNNTYQASAPAVMEIAGWSAPGCYGNIGPARDPDVFYGYCATGPLIGINACAGNPGTAWLNGEDSQVYFGCVSNFNPADPYAPSTGSMVMYTDNTCRFYRTIDSLSTITGDNGVCYEYNTTGTQGYHAQSIMLTVVNAAPLSCSPLAPFITIAIATLISHFTSI